MVDKIPDDFLIETDLTDEQKNILIEQINRFNKLNDTYRRKAIPVIDNDGGVFLTKGSIIHEIRSYNENKLDNISKTGILTGQAVGISENCETYYCADFHRVREDISISDYNEWFKINDGRCPFGTVRADNSSKVAFVVVPNESNQELLSYDCYRENTRESEITRSFINSMPIEDRELGSSILYGVPVSCIEGIIVGGEVLSDKNKIDFLIQKFPHCYITSAHGELIYNPSRNENLGDEIVELRRKLASSECERRKKGYEMSKMVSENIRIKENYDNLLGTLIMNANMEDVINILSELWHQGVSEDYVVSLRNNYQQKKHGGR